MSRFEQPAYVTEAGKLRLGDPTALNSWLHDQSGKQLVVTFSTYEEHVSDQLRAYYFVVIRELCIQLARIRGLDMPYPKDKIHYRIRGAFGPPGKGNSITDWTKEEMLAALMEIKAHFAQEYGITVPELGDEE